MTLELSERDVFDLHIVLGIAMEAESKRNNVKFMYRMKELSEIISKQEVQITR